MRNGCESLLGAKFNSRLSPGPLLIPMKVRSWGCPKFDPLEADLRGQMPEISPPDRRRSNSTVPEIEAGERRFHPTMPEIDLVG